MSIVYLATKEIPSECEEIDEYKHKCPIWARRGYCTTNVKFWKDLMTQHCCKDCKSKFELYSEECFFVTVL